MMEKVREEQDALKDQNQEIIKINKLSLKNLRTQKWESHKASR